MFIVHIYFESPFSNLCIFMFIFYTIHPVQLFLNLKFFVFFVLTISIIYITPTISIKPTFSNFSQFYSTMFSFTNKVMVDSHSDFQQSIRTHSNGKQTGKAVVRSDTLPLPSGKERQLTTELSTAQLKNEIVNEFLPNNVAVPYFINKLY